MYVLNYSIGFAEFVWGALTDLVDNDVLTIRQAYAVACATKRQMLNGRIKTLADVLDWLRYVESFAKGEDIVYVPKSARP